MMPPITVNQLIEFCLATGFVSDTLSDLVSDFVSDLLVVSLLVDSWCGVALGFVMKTSEAPIATRTIPARNAELASLRLRFIVMETSVLTTGAQPKTSGIT